MKKVIEGYIARDIDRLLFSNQPMKQGGFIGDGDVWYQTVDHEERYPLDFRVDMHKYMDIPELEMDNSPRRCTIIIEVGEFVGEKIDQDFMEKRNHFRRCIWAAAEGADITFEEAKAMLVKVIPDIEKYVKE